MDVDRVRRPRHYRPAPIAPAGQSSSCAMDRPQHLLVQTASRLTYLDDALGDIRSHDGVWEGTGEESANRFKAQ